MLWFVAFLLAFLLMSLSDKAMGHPLAFIGVAYLGLCFALVGGAILKVLGLT